MRSIKFILSLATTIGLVWALQTQLSVKDKALPPLGPFFNPFTGFWRNAEPSKGFTPQDLNLPGLSGKVQVVYDDLLVPHIFADNNEDAARVQGYVTASQRLWQMDITTRKASGRLSEVLGDRTLGIDRLTRRRGMVYAAENDLKGWQTSPETVRLLDAYTAGVNAYVDQLTPADYPIEFKLLNYTPEPWTSLKTALVVESMAENLASYGDDLPATNALQLFGRDTFAMLYPEWNPKQRPIIPDTGQWKGIVPNLPARKTGAILTGMQLPEHPAMPALADPDPYLKGSNNWAVNGTRTQSKNAILANDPHLNLTLPSIWYQVQIHTPQQNCYGVSLPGLPGVVIGFNDDIAWGMTNVSHDVSDWYKLQWTDATHTAYQYDGQPRKADLRIEEIKIKNKPTLLDTVRYTVWGPVVFDYDPASELRECALRWITHDIPEHNELSLFLSLNGGKNYADYKIAMSGFDCPAQNFVFATRSGDIAIQVQGRYPVRTPEQGRFIQDGSHSENAWHGFIPQDQVPSMKNPGRGFVFSANQHSTPPSYPYYYLGDFEDYRGRHLYDRLDALHDATIDSIKTMQLDNFSLRAAEALPLMLRLLDRSKLDADGRQIADNLAAWNYRYDAGQTTPPYYEVWYDSCYQHTWDEMFTIQKTRPVLFPESWRFIELLEKDTNNIFFDDKRTPQRETARDIVQASFQGMQHYFTANPQQRVAWGPYRGFALRHLALIDGFSRLDLSSIVGGQKSTLNAISRTNGPSWRMIVELSDKIHALGVYPGGQSGNPGSPYYDNMVNTWAKGEYYELLLLSKPDEAPARTLAQQTFNPGK